MKNTISRVLLILALGYIIYLSIDFFQGKKIVCNDVEISTEYNNYINQNNLLDSLCYYKKEVEKGQFKYLSNILNIDKSEKYPLESKSIIENLLVTSNEHDLKNYFNNESTIQFRLLVYFSLKMSNDPKSKNLLFKIVPINNGNDFRFK